VLAFAGHSNTVWIFSQDATREAIVRMIIKHEYPFSMVEHKGFVDFMKVAQPKFSIPGPMNVRNDCVKLFQHLKKIEMEKLDKVDHIHQGRIYGTGMPVPLRVFLLEPLPNDPACQFHINLK
jgi:hypothetical protein